MRVKKGWIAKYEGGSAYIVFGRVLFNFIRRGGTKLWLVKAHTKL